MLTIAVAFALASLVLIVATMANWHQTDVPGGHGWIASANTIVLAAFVATTSVFTALATIAWFLDERLAAIHARLAKPTPTPRSRPEA